MRRAGYRVSTAGHFERALEILEGDDCPDVLVTDIVMPSSINGVALCRMARVRKPSIKAIYVTGYDIPGIESEAFGPILRKPVEADNLVRIIAAELAKSASAG